MDDKRFDQLTRMVGQGASRRSILKGILGIGGATVAGALVDESVDARTARTRPTIPPPPPPTTQAPTTTTPAPCPGQQQCPNSALCCPTGTCARSGNQAICCDGSGGHGDTVCGLECCEDPLQCCDRECCGDLAVCLNRVFDGLPEEFCCPAPLTCDGGCCEGECYLPIGLPVLINGFPIPSLAFERDCCPVGNSVCQGVANATCCDDDTEQCCLRNGVAVCIPTDGCCTDVDCDGECDLCNQGTNQCVDAQRICKNSYGPCSICLNGTCIDEPELCAGECDTCLNGRCLDVPEDCPGDCEICLNGACIDVPDACLPTCEMCVNGTCVDDPDQFPCGGTLDDPLYCCPMPDYLTCCMPTATLESGAPECCGGLSDIPSVPRQCSDSGLCCEANAPYHCTATSINKSGCCERPCNANDQCCTLAMTPGEPPTEANACTDSDECCDGSFCCRGYCLPDGACCSQTVNPCDECERCVLAECVPDSDQNGDPCLMGQVCCEGTCCALGEICSEPAGVGPAQEPTCTPTTTTTTSAPTTTTTPGPCPGQIVCPNSDPIECCPSLTQCAGNGWCCALDKVPCEDGCCGPCTTCNDDGGGCVPDLSQDGDSCWNGSATSTCCEGVCLANPQAICPCPGLTQCDGTNANCCDLNAGQQCAGNGDCCASDRVACTFGCCGPCQACGDGACVADPMLDEEVCWDPANGYAQGICCSGACNSTGATTCATPTTTSTTTTTTVTCPPPGACIGGGGSVPNGCPCNGTAGVCVNNYCCGHTQVCGSTCCQGDEECFTCINGTCIYSLGNPCNGGAGVCSPGGYCNPPTTTTATPTTTTTSTTTTTTPPCSPVGTQNCAGQGALPCCSGYCINNQCAAGQSPDGGPCNGDLHCVSGFCNQTATCGCLVSGFSCVASTDCCSSAPYCALGRCNSCIPSTGDCSANPGACCSGLSCNGSTCVAP